MPINKPALDKLKSNLKKTFNDIDEKKSLQFVNAVLSIGAAESKEYAPVEYSNLVNSQRIDVDKSGAIVMGSVSFNVKYAAALEFGKWNPRPVSEKAGPASNMNATPHYLQKGFESPQSKRAIDKAIDIFRI